MTAATPVVPTQLPPTLRGPDGAMRLVQGIPLRVSVLGTRGKATLAGLLAAALRRRGLAVHCNSPRAARPADASFAQRAAALGFTWDDHGLVEAEAARLRQAWPVQAAVLANHARGTSGMRDLHAKVLLPHYVLLTNVRRDPSGLVSHPLPAVARSLVAAITPGAVVLCGEPDPAVRAVVRRECERNGLAYVDAAPKRSGLPAAELVSILSAFLQHRFGKPLDAEEDAAVRRELDARFRWSASSIPGVRWFDAGPIHDVDSAQIVLNHLQAQRRMPVTFVAYLRADRPGRTAVFVPFLEELLAGPDTRQVVLVGHRAAAVAERLERFGSQVRVSADDPTQVARLVRRLQFDCQGGAVVTLCNGTGAFPEELARQLQRPAPPGQAARPARPEAAAFPRRVVRPLVVPARVRQAEEAFAADVADMPGSSAPPAAALPLARAAVAAAAAVVGPAAQDPSR
jgi:hypothetical protein